MLADVPAMLVDIGIIAGVFTAVATAVAVFWKTPPVRWFRYHLSESLGDWLKARLHEAQADHHEYVRYHLGPNGDTKPIHRRLSDLEAAVGPPPPASPRLPVVDWHAPYSDNEEAL